MTAAGDRAAGSRREGDGAVAPSVGAVRVAAVDIGSNAMRFTAAEYRSGRKLGQLDYHRAAIRLGHDAFRTGRLTEENLDAAIAAMVHFRRRLDRYRIARYRAVATSAVRDAENGPELVEGARREADMEIEVIDGKEEARLVWRAVPDRMRPVGRWVLVDVGGGSMEVSTGRGEALERSETFPLGTVRLLERVEERGEAHGGGGGGVVDEVLTGLRGSLERALNHGDRGETGDRVLLATGGNIEALVGLEGSSSVAHGGRRIPLDALRRVTAEVEGLSYERRMEELGLRSDRADVIVPAGRLYLRVAELADVDEILVPAVSVSDGLLLELAGG